MTANNTEAKEASWPTDPEDEQARGAVVVTGANQRYWRSLGQLLLSAERHQKAQRPVQWICYDLGMSQESLRWLKRRFPWCQFRYLDLAAAPLHYEPATGSYAWKPHIIWEVLSETNDLVIWMDSANV